MKKKDSLKDKTPEQLFEELATLKKEVASTRFSALRGTPIKNLKEYKVQKKSIAQILTALNAVK